MKKPIQETIFLVLFMVLNLVLSLLLLVFALDANQKRQRGASERQEIICILKILPEERQRHPEKVDACSQR